MLRLGAIPAAAFLLSMVRAPESPRFLIQAGKTEMSHEFHDLFRPGLQKALIIGTLIKA